nr:putative reverse transcriptase domain-containing protein [Tanacetum cinerariifolium]
MSMNIRSSVKDKILATLSETPKVENMPAKTLRDLDQQMEKRADDGNSCIFEGARRYVDFATDVTPGTKSMQTQLFVANLLIPLRRGSFYVNVGMDSVSKNKVVIVCHEKVVRISLEGDGILRVQGERTQVVMKTLFNMKSEMDDLPRGLANAAESVRDAIRFNYHSSIRCAPFEALYRRKCRSPVLWAEIGESSLTRLELVQETTDSFTKTVRLTWGYELIEKQ